MVSFKAVSVLAKWLALKFGFKVCFSIGIFPSTDDVLFQTGFRGVSMSTRPVSESSCPERGSTSVSELASKYGFRFSFRLRFQSRALKSCFESRFQGRVSDPVSDLAPEVRFQRWFQTGFIAYETRARFHTHKKKSAIRKLC